MMSSAEYPRWDESHANTLVSTDEDGAFLEVRRTVWTKSTRRTGRHILWTGTVAMIPRAEVPGFARDIVSSLV
jgi:hypothetical protein